MPYRPWEEATPDSELPPPSTPTKSAGNDGASHADPDAEDPDRGSDEEEELGAKKIRPPTPCSDIRGCQALGHWREGIAKQRNNSCGT